MIVNHALYFAHLAAGGGVLPEHDAVVFDEAHRLEESAASWLGGRVSRAGLRRLAHDVERACREAQRPLPARAARSRRAHRRAAAARGRAAVGRKRLREVPAEPALVLIDALGDLAAALHGAGRGSRRARAPLARRRREVEACLEPGEPERVVWAEPDALAWAPVDVSAELRERLWDDGPTAILVSATLDDRRRRGLRPPSARARPRARIGRRLALRLPRAGAALRATGDARSTQRRVHRARGRRRSSSLLALSEGRALVLTSSYRALDAYREHVRGRVPYDVLVQGEAPRERLLERFRTEVDSVLLATSTFWQGVDVPGESLSLLVIDKLPFSAPGDPLHEARCEAVERAAATGSATTPCRPRCCSCARASAA